MTSEHTQGRTTMNSQIFKVLMDSRRTLNHLLLFAEMQTMERQTVCDRIDQIDAVLQTPQEKV